MGVRELGNGLGNHLAIQKPTKSKVVSAARKKISPRNLVFAHGASWNGPFLGRADLATGVVTDLSGILSAGWVGAVCPNWTGSVLYNLISGSGLLERRSLQTGELLSSHTIPTSADAIYVGLNASGDFILTKDGKVFSGLESSPLLVKSYQAGVFGRPAFSQSKSIFAVTVSRGYERFAELYDANTFDLLSSVKLHASSVYDRWFGESPVFNEDSSKALFYSEVDGTLKSYILDLVSNSILLGWPYGLYGGGYWLHVKAGDFGQNKAGWLTQGTDGHASVIQTNSTFIAEDDLVYRNGFVNLAGYRRFGDFLVDLDRVFMWFRVADWPLFPGSVVKIHEFRSVYPYSQRYVVGDVDNVAPPLAV